MIIEDLIKHLQTFDKKHSVEMEIDTECGCLIVGSVILDVEFKQGKCVLYGRDY